MEDNSLSDSSIVFSSVGQSLHYAVGLILLLTSGCGMLDFFSTRERPPPQIPALRFYAFQGRQIYLNHVALPSDVEPGTVVTARVPLGKIEDAPAQLSEHHHEKILQAYALYEQRRYADALTLIERLHRDEPRNKFILDIYGRALFRTDQREQAFAVYRRLIEMIDRENEFPRGAVLVDAWFIDAYWKLGMLHLDRGEYGKAAFEISRALAVTLERNPALEPALGYLTEAYFYLGDYEASKYYANETLRINPSNLYVLSYLGEMPR